MDNSFGKIILIFIIVVWVPPNAAGQKTNKLTPEAVTVNSWPSAIQNIALQVFRPFPSDELLRVSVGNFLEAQTGERISMGQAIESDLKAVISQVENVEFIERKSMGREMDFSVNLPPRYVLSGLYQMSRYGLRINAILKEFSSGRVMSSSRVIIRTTELEAQDLAVLEQKMPQPKGQNKAMFEEYPFSVDTLLATEPGDSSSKVEVWTDKKIYQIGERIIFYFRADRETYVTLIDVGTSGEMRILFPNKFQRDNLVENNTIYAIPSSRSGFTIKVEGPPGLERVKAIATVRPLSGMNLNLKEVFDVFPRNDQRRTRDLRITARKLAEQSWAEDYIEFYVTKDGEIPNRFGRERAIIPKDEPNPPEKPIDIIGVPGVNSQPETFSEKRMAPDNQ